MSLAPVRRILARLLDLIYDGFDRSFAVVNWTFLLVGLVALLLTLFGKLPGAGDGWYGRMVASIGWALVAKDGFSDLERAR